MRVSEQPDEKTILEHCNNCLRKTRHLLLFQEADEYVEVEGQFLIFRSTTTHRFLKCCGCGSHVYSRYYIGDDDPNGSTERFPSSVFRSKPKWLNSATLSSTGSDYEHCACLESLLSEIYRSIDRDNLRLACMGIRAAFDMVLTDQLGGDFGGFNKKLELAHEKEILTICDIKTVESALEMGNAASHRGYKPDPKAIDHLLDILENLMQRTYILPNVAALLKEQTPERNPKK